MVDRNVSKWFRAIGAIAFAIGFSGSGTTLAAQATGSGPGPEVCNACHADRVKGYEASVHGAKGNLSGPANAGQCSTCHGDGTEHVKAGGGRGVGGIKNPGGKLMSADDKSNTCLNCHKRDSKRSHWDGSTHQLRGTACTSCHTVHSRDRVRDKRTQFEVCFTCHKDKRVEINRPSRHAILEGKVGCSDCHNPHGSVGPKLMKRDSVVETCYQCHMEKRGPFVHSHEPVNEDCTTCHNPHGTVTEDMLKLRPPFLCHQCHTPHGGNVLVLRGQPGVVPSATAGKSGINYTQGRGCRNCHSQIHGTNNPASGTPLGDPTPRIFFR